MAITHSFHIPFVDRYACIANTKKETKIRIGIFIRTAQDLSVCFVRVTLSRKEGILRF